MDQSTHSVSFYVAHPFLPNQNSSLTADAMNIAIWSDLIDYFLFCVNDLA